MKILVFSDLHLSEPLFEQIEHLAKIEKPDLMLDLGDITVFGEGIDYAYARLALLDIPMLAIHGNHESQSQMKEELDQYPQFTFLHKDTKKIGDVLFVAYGGLGFSERTPGFTKWVKKLNLKDEKKIIFMTHQPPYGTKLDIVYGEHVGHKDFVDFIKKNKNIKYALSGHIHDCAFQEEKINNAVCINMSMAVKIIEL